MTAKDIRDRLFELADRKYKEFHEKLIPNVNPDFVIGVRTPVLRKLAKEIYADAVYICFLRNFRTRIMRKIIFMHLLSNILRILMNVFRLLRNFFHMWIIGQHAI